MMTLGRYYDRDGKEIDPERWGDLRKHRSYCIVDKTVVGEAEVSTVWLGLDHQWTPDGPLLIFETMIFGGEWDQQQWRYTTAGQAQARHDRIVAALRAGAEPE